MNATTAHEIEAALTALAPGLGAGLSAVATPLVGTLAAGVLVLAAKLLDLAVDPEQALVAILNEADPLAQARGKVTAAEDAKYGGAVAVAAAGVSERETADDPYPDPSEDV